ncbi:MAG: choice-of-anchor K domain-containing protein [Cyanobacteriota bacterium]|nr:choice-of-anchor K domain-containing protein [Cyanobacteriota bacterium]
MKILLTLGVLSCALSPIGAIAADYALSPNGLSVVRKVPSGVASAGSLDPSLLPSGWTMNTTTGGSTSITSYSAGFRGTTGGAEFTSLYQGVTPVTGSYFEWVQVINTNAPLSGTATTYLDNAADTSRPFYSFTAANLTPGLPADQIDFYDFSTRDQSLILSTNPVTWSASLYPVVVDSANHLLVHDGVTWGWTMKKATVGNISGTFSNPTPSSAVITGAGTSTLGWGSGDPSSISFAGLPFDTQPGEVFNLGRLTFYNGSILSGTGADAALINLAFNFENIPEKNTVKQFSLAINNTLNTADPIASADSVTLSDFGYTFNVLEGRSASVSLLGMLTSSLTGTPQGTESGAWLYSDGGIDPMPEYNLMIVGFADPSDGGFVTEVPGPLSIAGVSMAYRYSRRLRSRMASGMPRKWNGPKI